MSISSYADLISAAQSQNQPQRLLFVFTRAELPPGADAEQKARFAEGRGGVLTPIACVDKLPQDVAQFNGLVEEARIMGIDWDVAFIGALGGQQNQPPSRESCEGPLKAMVERIKQGNISSYLALRKDGELIQLSAV